MADLRRIVDRTKEELERIPWTVENTALAVNNDKSDYVLLFKKERIPYILELHIDCNELYVVLKVGLTWVKIVKHLKISELLKHILTWLAKSPGAKGSFFSMCKYLFNLIDALSVIGTRKEQREFIDILVRHLPFLFTRYRGVILYNECISFKKGDDNGYAISIQI